MVTHHPQIGNFFFLINIFLNSITLQNQPFLSKCSIPFPCLPLSTNTTPPPSKQSEFQHRQQRSRSLYHYQKPNNCVRGSYQVNPPILQEFLEYAEGVQNKYTLSIRRLKDQSFESHFIVCERAFCDYVWVQMLLLEHTRRFLSAFSAPTLFTASSHSPMA